MAPASPRRPSPPRLMSASPPPGGGKRRQPFFPLPFCARRKVFRGRFTHVFFSLGEPRPAQKHLRRNVKTRAIRVGRGLAATTFHIASNVLAASSYAKPWMGQYTWPDKFENTISGQNISVRNVSGRIACGWLIYGRNTSVQTIFRQTMFGRKHSGGLLLGGLVLGRLYLGGIFVSK